MFLLGRDLYSRPTPPNARRPPPQDRSNDLTIEPPAPQFNFANKVMEDGRENG